MDGMIDVDLDAPLAGERRDDVAGGPAPHRIEAVFVEGDAVGLRHMEPGPVVGGHRVGERAVAVEEQGVVVLKLPGGGMGHGGAGCAGFSGGRGPGEPQAAALESNLWLPRKTGLSPDPHHAVPRHRHPTADAPARHPAGALHLCDGALAQLQPDAVDAALLQRGGARGAGAADRRRIRLPRPRGGSGCGRRRGGAAPGRQARAAAGRLASGALCD